MIRTYTALLSMALLLGGFSVAVADGFTTVLNVPPDTLDSLVLDSSFNARVVPSGTQVNLTAFPTTSSSLSVSEGGELNFSAVGFEDIYARGGVVNFLEGGEVFFLQSYPGGQVNVRGGIVANLVLRADGMAIVSGGQVKNVDLDGEGSQVLIEGGSIVGGAFLIGILGDDFDIEAEANITGGEIFPERLGTLVVSSKAILEMSGGDIHFENTRGYLYEGSQVNFSGYDFAIDGVPLSGLAFGEPMEVFDRDVTLSGRLTDGSPFSLVLESEFASEEVSTFFAPPGAHVSVTYAIPEPGAFLLALLGMAGAASGRVGRRG